MSKQHRSRRAGPESSPKGEQASAERTEQLLGNQAVAQQILGSEVGVGEDAVAEARTLVERGFYALYAEPRDQARVEHWVSVIDGSKLSTERKVALADKLVGDQEAALAAQAAVERWFGGAEAEAVEVGLQALDGVWAGLDGLQGRQGVQPDTLIGELASEQGEAVVGFCREVYLILGFQEEEEEEEEGQVGDLTPEQE